MPEIPAPTISTSKCSLALAALEVGLRTFSSSGRTPTSSSLRKTPDSGRPGMRPLESSVTRRGSRLPAGGVADESDPPAAAMADLCAESAEADASSSEAARLERQLLVDLRDDGREHFHPLCPALETRVVFLADQARVLCAQPLDASPRDRRQGGHRRRVDAVAVELVLRDGFHRAGDELGAESVVR